MLDKPTFVDLKTFDAMAALSKNVAVVNKAIEAIREVEKEQLSVRKNSKGLQLATTERKEYANRIASESRQAIATLKRVHSQIDSYLPSLQAYTQEQLLRRQRIEERKKAEGDTEIEEPPKRGTPVIRGTGDNGAETSANRLQATQKLTKNCPFCGEKIIFLAAKCVHCEESLDGSNRQVRKTPPSQEPQPKEAKYNWPNDTFIGTMPVLVKLAIRAVQELEWKLDNANEVLGIVTFETANGWSFWTQFVCSLDVEEVSENHFRVTGTGREKMRSGQLFSLCPAYEGRRKAQKAINKMKELARW